MGQLVNILTIIGLTLDIFGVVMLFKYGLPPSLALKGALFADTPTDEEDDRERRKYRVMSNMALSLLIAGFAFQMVAPVFQVFIKCSSDKPNCQATEYHQHNHCDREERNK